MVTSLLRVVPLTILSSMMRILLPFTVLLMGIILEETAFSLAAWSGRMKVLSANLFFMNPSS